ncbi:MAG: Lrp/AsnC family transcriptional regulator [Flavobacteriales bacterium]|nr:Lrp/AsnC family transcriptional regulator [Flavobacteriales bacterium]
MAEGVKLDKIDKEILSRLKVHGKMSHKELAHLIGLTITPTYERVKRLERLGVIAGYTIKVDKSVIGKGLKVICHVSLKAHNHEVIANFEDSIVHLDEVSSCFHIAGAFDYSLLIEVENMQHYEYFLKEKLSKIPDISHVQSSFVMSELKKS